MTPVIKSFRTELDPTIEQRKQLARSVGCARFAYNWGLRCWRWQWGRAHRWADNSRRALRLLLRLAPNRPLSWYKVRARQAARKPSWQSLHKELVACKKTDFPWLTQVSAYAVREAVRDLGDAYKHFFRRLKKHGRGDHSECGRARDGRCQLGEPRFRSRIEPAGKGWHCMQPSALGVRVNSLGATTHIKVPSVGFVRLKERGYIPSTGLRGLAVRERAGRWFVSVQAEVVHDPKPRVDGVLGVEVGIRSLAVTSSGARHGRIIDLSGLDTVERKTKLWQRRMARRFKRGVAIKDQSKGWFEARREVAKYQGRGSDIRRNATQQASTRVVREGASVVAIRDNDVSDMMGRGGKNAAELRKRTRMVQIVRLGNMYEFRRQIEYKQGWAGGLVITAPSDFPSTKMCSKCKAVRVDDPGYPDFSCPVCGHVQDREDNSARNLVDFATGNSGKPPGGHSGGKPPKGGTMAGGTGNGRAGASSSGSRMVVKQTPLAPATGVTRSIQQGCTSHNTSTGNGERRSGAGGSTTRKRTLTDVVDADGSAARKRGTNNPKSLTVSDRPLKPVGVA